MGGLVAVDAKQKKELLIVMVLLFVLAALWTFVFSSGHPRSPEGQGGAMPAASQHVTSPPMGQGAVPAGTGEVKGAEPMPDMKRVTEMIVESRRYLLEAPVPDTTDVTDPFRAKGPAGSVEPAQVISPIPAMPELRFTLTAIMWDQQPMAIVNGRAVGVGDLVGEGISVEKIEPSEVLLSFFYNGRRQQLHLPLKPKGKEL